MTFSVPWCLIFIFFLKNVEQSFQMTSPVGKRRRPTTSLGLSKSHKLAWESCKGVLHRSLAREFCIRVLLRSFAREFQQSGESCLHKLYLIHKFLCSLFLQCFTMLQTHSKPSKVCPLYIVRIFTFFLQLPVLSRSLSVHVRHLSGCKEAVPVPVIGHRL